MKMERNFTHRVMLAHVGIDLQYADSKLEKTTNLKRAQELFATAKSQEEKEVYYAQYHRAYQQVIYRKGKSSRLAKMIDWSPDRYCRYNTELRLHNHLRELLEYEPSPRGNVSEFKIINKAILDSDKITSDPKLRQELDSIIICKINQELAFNTAHESICRDRLLEKASTDGGISTTTDMLVPIISSFKRIGSSRLLEYYFSFPKLAIIDRFGEDYPCLFSESEIETIKRAVDDELIKRKIA